MIKHQNALPEVTHQGTSVNLIVSPAHRRQAISQEKCWQFTRFAARNEPK